jgi:hypothetical protein
MEEKDLSDKVQLQAVNLDNVATQMLNLSQKPLKKRKKSKIRIDSRL